MRSSKHGRLSPIAYPIHLANSEPRPRGEIVSAALRTQSIKPRALSCASCPPHTLLTSISTLDSVSSTINLQLFLSYKSKHLLPLATMVSSFAIVANAALASLASAQGMFTAAPAATPTSALLDTILTSHPQAPPTALPVSKSAEQSAAPAPQLPSTARTAPASRSPIRLFPPS